MGERTRRILVIRNAYSFDFGGAERIAVDLAAELQTHGYQPIVVSRSPKILAYASSRGLDIRKGWWWKRQDWSGINMLLVPVYFAWQLLVSLWYVQLIMRTRADVVHPGSRDDFIAATVAAKLTGKRVIWTDNADLKYVYQNYSVWYKNPIAKLIYFLSKKVRAVILVSKNEKKHIEEALGRAVPHNYVVIYDGVPSTKIVPAKRPPEDKDALIFAATSRLVRAKGIGELIEAFNSFSKTHKNTRLWLFGEGPEADHFKNLAGQNDQIIFWGFPESTLQRVASADVFVHPSYHEGFSISLIEATKLGLPIIACDVGGNPEIITPGKNGILTPAQNSDALAEAMTKLAASKELRERYGQASREIYEKNLVFETIVKEKFIPLYE